MGLSFHPRARRVKFASAKESGGLALRKKRKSKQEETERTENENPPLFSLLPPVQKIGQPPQRPHNRKAVVFNGGFCILYRMEKIGFVGVGRMGANMARRLQDQGFPVVAVFDVNQEAAGVLAQELGAEACTHLKRVTELSDAILTVVTDDAAMKRIYLDGLLARARGKLFINCATVSPAVHVWVEQKAEKAGARSLEACMASSITQAREGSLYLMCGGKEETFQQAKPILDKLAASTRHIGPVGQAATVKALVNMVMNINTAGLAEGLGLGAALGLDLDMLREVFSQTGANSRVLQTDGEDMQKREHSCYFSAAHAAKDSGIALRLAREQGLRLPLATATKKQYDKMVAEGLGELDKSGVAELTFKGRHEK
jgi:3-hydroxyisobutyrate dehydrogenase